MKKLILFSATLLFVFFANAQIVNIPDASFKYALVIDTSINTNQDGEIQVSEASSYTGVIDVTFLSIFDLTGIEAFTALTGLHCFGNQLTSIDVSNNTALVSFSCFANQLSTLDVSYNNALVHIDCTGNQLDSLDISNNTALTSLYCGNNQLTSLNVSNNTVLTYLDCINNNLSLLDISNNTVFEKLWCYNNQLTTLDVSNNILLTDLWCKENQLVSLNVKNGNNVNFEYFRAENNPNLYCIEVDDSTWSTTNWHYVDSIASFSEDCSNSVSELQTTILSVYPNPSTGVIRIEAEGVVGIEVMDITGKTIKNTVIASKAKQSAQNNEIATGYHPRNDEIDLSHQPKGIYIIKVTTSNGVAVEKVILE